MRRKKQYKKDRDQREQLFGLQSVRLSISLSIKTLCL